MVISDTSSKKDITNSSIFYERFQNCIFLLFSNIYLVVKCPQILTTKTTMHRYFILANRRIELFVGHAQTFKWMSSTLVSCHLNILFCPWIILQEHCCFFSIYLSRWLVYTGECALKSIPLLFPLFLSAYSFQMHCISLRPIVIGHCVLFTILCDIAEFCSEW